jgi:hypothetical protein
MVSSIYLLLGSFIIYAGLVEYFKRVKLYSLSTIYFLLHFLTNVGIILTILPYALTLINDPLGLDFELEYDDYNNFSSISDCYIIIISLHFIHIFYQNNAILWDEKLHHAITIIFWFMARYLQHPIFSVGLINTSGLPGGITYLMLFLKNLNYISTITEKRISMGLNIWIRAPFTIFFSTLMYGNLAYSEYDLCKNLCILFMCGFNIYNGIHFMGNIIKSYYEHEHKIKN